MAVTATPSRRKKQVNVEEEAQAHVEEEAHEKAFDMTDSHKAALALGREQSRVVRDYLTALSHYRPKRGRKRSIESMEQRIVEIGDEVDTETDPLKRLELIAEREHLEQALSSRQDVNVLVELEEKFVEIAASYSRRKGVSYRAWRESGIAPGVLRRAGIARSE